MIEEGTKGGWIHKMCLLMVYIFLKLKSIIGNFKMLENINLIFLTLKVTTDGNDSFVHFKR